MQKYSELLRTILQKRGIKDQALAEIFLNPDYERDLHDPFKMKDMEKACVKLFEVIENKEKTIIYADYDCDGIPGAVVLEDLFKKIGYENYKVYIPGRNSEGYGLNSSAIEQFVEKKVKLLITIDLGITAVSEIAQAEVQGIDVIVTDHHLPHTTLPRAYAILNPKVDDYPEKTLCGAGVVFKLVQGFVKKYGEFYKINTGWEKWLLDMVGIATLSDLVPLLGENRALSYFGMKVLKKSPRVGLQKLLSKMKIDQKYLNEDDVGFMIAPRLNAASRMDDPMRAYEILSTEDEVNAGILADHLSKINDDRKTMVASIMREVNKKFEKREIREVIVVGNPKWRVGVLGLVASKIVDQYKRPVFVWGKDENDLIKGSCRSDGSVSLVELMTEANESFLEFGGHEFAGGFTVDNEKIHSLEDVLSLSFVKVARDKIEEKLIYDVESDLSIVNMKSWRELEKLAPFGFDNPKPIFLFKNINIENIKKFGKNGSLEHLEITFSNIGKNKIKAISFFSDNDSFKKTINEGDKADLLATFDLSRFRGREELRLRIIDII
ncbi:MAG: Single-stranded-DNA-specific exonuclease RecJ [Candidatus Nomurabacteria bacterium GW2011_GWE1_32_28]|uniref:Single-stranded-DNA-specific exonuclease RecJ n=1 Tax=Candidatus Nomurabacteria bacterium GW2011_GWF1_31_48 TaxID=1618767 RepID=A0A0F9YE71_9BACT|nr:MAG: Single-stranded-DNA-specific exonuclease RecJ [Candidatus Nomurabacteria bacterium GW2011_GWF2_30_133]KKP28429.1 MAG: Single-stranded-DNA-specific exonuclease RecJ [Candidatus Nomurabacteria bacterium GW2011_GWE2_31_40]KKP30009.1 MAG: Single-stranded-DNA-specific exonuclease RecJ [Candidatus Nomurabacteria bacterium GW2011_GWF1_31_48]KKP34528.1 MAG: Single-stranded-DNA-specific exonuclease RecJ [Candidatus Nomurabacteria bacterium GW2011_GWE1_32_28]HAS81073.1 single-stranded-DNA-specifi